MLLKLGTASNPSQKFDFEVGGGLIHLVYKFVARKLSRKYGLLEPYVEAILRNISDIIYIAEQLKLIK